MTTDISGGEEKTLDDEHGELSESSEASSEELEEGDDANSKNDYPKPPEKFQKKGLTKRPVSSQVISNDGEYEMHRPKPTKKKKTAHTQSTTRQSKTSTPPEDDNTRNSGFPISEARFQQRVLHMLSEIKNTLAQVGKRCEPEDSDFHITKANSLDEIQELESSLEDEKLQNLLFSRLCKVGGITATENVRNVMHRLMENKVMANMNFKGKGGKYAFGETKMFQMVKRNVLRNQPNTTETEITKIVMALLKYAPDRAGGGGRKQN